MTFLSTHLALLLTLVMSILSWNAFLGSSWEHLHVKRKKYEFHLETVAFIRYVISPNGVMMEEVDQKVDAVMNWPKPTSVKERQHFLGFTNFYQQCIWDLSTIVVPLTELLKGDPWKLSWSLQAESAFWPTELFTSSTVLKHPDPSELFVVEVNASETDVQAVLS